jgi:ADP-sugar diphosphatase
MGAACCKSLFSRRGASASSRRDVAANPCTKITREIQIHGRAVPVSAVPQTPPLDLEAAIESAPFVRWVAGLDRRIEVQSVRFQSLDWFGKRVGFVKFEAQCTYETKPCPGIVFARGAAVSVLPVLINAQNSAQKFVLCCRQARVPVGRILLELPAGMMDDQRRFAGVAAKEMQEETGIEIQESELMDLTALAYGAGALAASDLASASACIVPSGGGCDETIRLFLWVKTMEQAKIEELQFKLTGNTKEGEAIRLELVPLDELWRQCTDVKALCSLLLMEKLQLLDKLQLLESLQQSE